MRRIFKFCDFGFSFKNHKAGGKTLDELEISSQSDETSLDDHTYGGMTYSETDERDTDSVTGDEMGGIGEQWLLY